MCFAGFKPLKCKYCFRPFGDPSNLNKHIRLHTQGGDQHHHGLNSSSENPSLYRCHLCNKGVHKRRDLLRHLQLAHGNAETQSSGQEDSQMTLLYSPAQSSQLSSSSNDEEEETEVVDC